MNWFLREGVDRRPEGLVDPGGLSQHLGDQEGCPRRPEDPKRLRVPG